MRYLRGVQLGQGVHVDLEAPGDQEDLYTVDQATSEIVEKGEHNTNMTLW